MGELLTTEQFKERINRPGADGNTPLSRVVRQGWSEIFLLMLIQSGYLSDTPEFRELLDQPLIIGEEEDEKSEKTLLQIAIENGRRKITRSIHFVAHYNSPEWLHEITKPELKPDNLAYHQERERQHDPTNIFSIMVISVIKEKSK